jgi:hypothetical protein
MNRDSNPSDISLPYINEPRIAWPIPNTFAAAYWGS